MKTLRVLCILLLIAGLVAGSAVEILAKGPPEGKGPSNDNAATGKVTEQQQKGKKKGFSGNVTSAIEIFEEDIIGNITLLTNQGWTAGISVANSTIYKVPGKTKGWLDDYDEFIEILDEDLTALIGWRVSLQAGNVTGSVPGPFSGTAIKLLVLPKPGPPLHAHRTGNVTWFSVDAEGEGNITIMDVHGIGHTFEIGNETVYRPQGITALIIEVGSFVTVVTTGDPKLGPPAKAIVLHKPE